MKVTHPPLIISQSILFQIAHKQQKIEKEFNQFVTLLMYLFSTYIRLYSNYDRSERPSYTIAWPIVSVCEIPLESSIGGVSGSIRGKYIELGEKGREKERKRE